MPFIHTVNVRGKAGALRTDQLEAAVAAVEAAPKNYSPGWRRALRDELSRRQSRHVVDGYNVEFQGARPARAGEDY
jgi:hypothetical protein